VADLGVELHAPQALRAVAHDREGAVVRAGVDLEALRQALDLVAVAHPDHGAALDRLEQPLGPRDGHRGAPELALVRGAHVAAELLAHPLHAVADAQDGQAELEQLARNLGRVGRVDRGRAAGEDHAGEVHAPGELQRLVRRRDLAPGARLAHAARDQLRVLRAQVDDQDAARFG
jgi:hypothetical protein